MCKIMQKILYNLPLHESVPATTEAQSILQEIKYSYKMEKEGEEEEEKKEHNKTYISI